MGFVHYVGRAPSRARLLRGDTPAWVSNSSRSRYIAAVLLSAPPWVDRKALYALHEQAQALTRSTGRRHVLDHIVPLNHPRVCGIPIHISPDWPRLTLSKDVPVTDEFRKDFDAWALGFFGAYNLLEDGQWINVRNGQAILMNPRTFEQLRAATR